MHDTLRAFAPINHPATHCNFARTHRHFHMLHRTNQATNPEHACVPQRSTLNPHVYHFSKAHVMQFNCTPPALLPKLPTQHPPQLNVETTTANINVRSRNLSIRCLELMHCLCCLTLEHNAMCKVGQQNADLLLHLQTLPSSAYPTPYHRPSCCKQNQSACAA